RFAGFAQRDLEVALCFLAPRRCARAGIARCTRACALQLARHAAAKSTKLILARRDEDERLLCELIREQSLVVKVVIRCVVSGVRHASAPFTTFSRSRGMADPDRNERAFPCAVQGGVTGEAWHDACDQTRPLRSRPELGPEPGPGPDPGPDP